jgi:hypothetical protein
MGLDCWLYGKKYLYEFMNKENPKIEEKIKENFKDIKDFKLIEVVFEIGYWRKANHIHKWFVDNVQNGEDDCKDYDVSSEDLKKLLKICKEVLKGKSKAKELLPTQTGFFFGNTEYNDEYFNDIKDTIKIIEKAIKLKGVEFYYSSSW